MKAKEYTFDASYQPQVRTKTDTSRIMLDVIIALVPAMAFAVYQFGFKVLALLAISVASAVFFEWGYRKLMKKPGSINDLSACVTGILLVLCLPVDAPLWMPVIGTFFAIVIVKQLYGGIGKNFVNPALAGRAFLFFSWTATMTSWAVPKALGGVSVAADAVTMATPLSILKEGGDIAAQGYDYLDMFLGFMPGSIGEISALALLIGGAYLLIRKVISWQIPVAYIGTVAVLTFLFPQGNDAMSWMLYNVLGGGLFLGAFFMATDYVTSPVTKKGQLIFGLGCGLITVFIRYFGSYPEGVCYSILIMNCTTWLLDKYIRPTIYGAVKKEKKEAAK